jgi:hypothetical protein
MIAIGPACAPSSGATSRVFHLESRGAGVLPQVLARTLTAKVELLGGTLVLRGDGTYVARNVYRSTPVGASPRHRARVTDTAVATGAFAVHGDTVVLTEPKKGHSSAFLCSARGNALEGPGIPAANRGLAYLAVHVYRRRV